MRSPLGGAVLGVMGLAVLGLGLSGCGSHTEQEIGAEQGGVVPPHNELPNQVSTLGYNLDFPGDWTDLPPFIDMLKNSRAPVGECGDEPDCDGAAHLDLAVDGWPKSLRYRDDAQRSYRDIQIIINSSNNRPDIGERFVVTWEGSGSLHVGHGADVKSEGAHRLSFTLRSDVTWLTLDEIDPAGSGDYLRNIRVFRADQERFLDQGELFNPEMLAFLAPFRNLRFMDWMQSNTPGQCSGGSRNGEECYAVIDDNCGGGGRCLMPGHWQERPDDSAPSLLASSQYLDPKHPELGTKVGGYALETLVALANRLPADAHFNLPADYDEDYVRNFAQYLKSNLAPGLVASVEYSNEVWNWGFPQAEYANQQGQALWGADEGSAWVQYMAGRTQTACNIIKDVFGAQAARIRCLISPQTGWRDLAKTVLDCPLWAADHPGAGTCSSAVDAVNITGYFSGCLPKHPELINSWLSEGKSAALNHGFEQLEHGGLIDDCTDDDEDNLDYTVDGYRYFGELAKSRGLGLYVYESGTHFNYEADDDGVRDFFVSMTRDERMYDLYTKNFRGFQSQGGEILNVWGWIAPDDMWANADSVLDRQHPKYRAITDFAAAAH